ARNQAARPVQYAMPSVSQNEPLGFSGAMAEPQAGGDPLTGGVFEEQYYDMPVEPMDPEGPAPAVSSREWLKSGLWYTQQSAVYMDRSANTKNTIRLSEDPSSVNFNPLLFHYSNRLELPVGMGYEPGLRSTLGRLLGRDDRNRDHAIEFTFLGLT